MLKLNIKHEKMTLKKVGHEWGTGGARVGHEKWGTKNITGAQRVGQIMCGAHVGLIKYK